MTRAVLLVGFGGPERPEEIRPFLADVLRGRPVPPQRVEEVARQYERIGGRSPYNDLAADLARALESRLAGRPGACPVVIGMRHGRPSLEDTLRALRSQGVREVTALPLSAYRSIPSFHYYLRATAQALKSVGGGLRLRWIQPWFAEERFVQALIERVAETLALVPAEGRGRLRWFFTAHSIPIPWDESSGYSKQIRGVAERVARHFGQRDWTLAYQSRSGRPEDPWLEPDISDLLSRARPEDGGEVLVVPLGFLMDHVEVLYDLDVRARDSAERAGLRYHRSKTVGTHPVFVDLLVDLLDRSTPPVAPTSPGPRASGGRFRVGVVGGGISGLAAAHRLTEQARERGIDLDLTVWESAPRSGGVIETGRRNGFLWESGPDSFITEKPAAVALARRLGIESEIIGTNPRHQQSFVAKGARLHPTPEGFYLLAPSKLGPLFRTPLLSWPGKVRAALELFLPPRVGAEDETLGSFVRRRFGREVLDRLAQPMVAGIYSADPEALSLRATFPRFLEMEARHGGVIRALLAGRRKARGPALPAGTRGPRYGLFATFRDGVGSLVDRLVTSIGAERIRTGATVTNLTRAAKGWRFDVRGHSTVDVDAVILACPSTVSAGLLRGVDPSLARELAGTPYGSVATLNVAVRRDRLRHPLNGFGFVVPSLEHRAVTGCTFSSVKFAGRAPDSHALLRAFVGGPILETPDDALLRAVRRDLDDFLGMTGDPDWCELRRYPGAMPQYTLGHGARVAEVFRRAAALEGLALCGNGYYGIGLPDCIALGESAADRVLSFVPQRTFVPEEALA